MKTQVFTWLFVCICLAACSPTPTTEPGPPLPVSPSPVVQAENTPTPAQPVIEIKITPLPGKTLVAGSLPVFQALRVHAAGLFQVPVDDVVVVSYEPVDWSDSCLGAGGAAEICMQMITPGYLVFLDVRGSQVEAHIDSSGRNIRIINQPGLEGHSGISGTVMIGPVCGGPVSVDQTPCPDQPYQAAITIFDQHSQPVLQVNTDEQGLFQVALPPGVYTLHPESPGKMPYAGDIEVTVTEGQFTPVQINYDSGIR